MTISDNSGEAGPSPSGRIDVESVKGLVHKIAKKRFVGGTLEVEIPDPDVIVGFHVNIKFGWTNVIAVRAPGDGEGMIGTLHIRTTCPTLPPATAEELLLMNKYAVLMRFACAGDDGVEARSRLPIFSGRAQFEVLESAVEQIIRLQRVLLLGAFQDRYRARELVRAMDLCRPPREQMQAAFRTLRRVIGTKGFGLVELDANHWVINRTGGAPPADAYRIEISTHFRHKLFGAMTRTDLVVPWVQRSTPALLNRKEEEVEDETLGVGTWHASSDESSLRYGIQFPFTEHWGPWLELFVSDLIVRWLNTENANCELMSHVFQARDRSALFSSMRSRYGDELRKSIASQSGPLSLEDYYRELAARDLVASMAGIPVRSLDRIVGPPPKRPRR